MRFSNRSDAGRELADMLKKEDLPPIDLVLGLPRGGVIVAAEVARQLDTALDVVLVRKVGLPGHEELAIGAVAEDMEPIFNSELLHIYNVKKKQLTSLVDLQKEEIFRRQKLYAPYRLGAELKGKSILLVDDGIATGATVRAAIQYLRQKQIHWLAVAVPVAAAETIDSLTPHLDGMFCLFNPLFLDGVGQWYDSFEQITDQQVILTLKDFGVLQKAQ